MKGCLALMQSDTIERRTQLNRVFPYKFGRRRSRHSDPSCVAINQASIGRNANGDSGTPLAPWTAKSVVASG
jgi:hypothetical protein